MTILATPGIPETMPVRDVRSRTRTALLLSCTMWLTTASQVAAQRVPDRSYYEAVLDSVFRAPAEQDEGELSLRFVDVEDAEMEVAIRFHPAEFDVVVTALASGQASVWEQLSRLPDAVRLPPVDEVAPLIKIRRGSIRVSRSSELGKLLASGTRLSMNFEPSPFIFLHGASYWLTITSSAKDMRVKLYGPRDPARSDEPVVRWMGKVRQAVQKALPAEQLASIGDEFEFSHDVPVEFALTPNRFDFCTGADGEVGTMRIVLRGTLTNRFHKPIALCVRCIGQASVRPSVVGTSGKLDEQTMDDFDTEYRVVSAGDFTVVEPGASVRLQLTGTAVVNLPGRAVSGLATVGETDFAFTFGVGGWDPSHSSTIARQLGTETHLLSQDLPVASVRVTLDPHRPLVDCDAQREVPPLVLNASVP